MLRRLPSQLSPYLSLEKRRVDRSELDVSRLLLSRCKVRLMVCGKCKKSATNGWMPRIVGLDRLVMAAGETRSRSRGGKRYLKAAAMQ